jgi:3'-5' exoribonuclease 1
MMGLPAPFLFFFQDIRDFIAKQIYISQIPRPLCLARPFIDIRVLALQYFLPFKRLHNRSRRAAEKARVSPLAMSSPTSPSPPSPPRKMPDNLTTDALLRALSLAGFEGRQHCGLDDARNSARVLQELASRGHRLSETTTVKSSAELRWDWMKGKGKVGWTAPTDNGAIR